MILQALVEFYESMAARGEMPPFGWMQVPVSYLLCINTEGELTQVIHTTHDVDMGKKKVTKPVPRMCPAQVSRTVGVESNFLCDHSGYLLGVDNKGKPKRSRECFDACRELHHAILDGVDSEAARAVLAFLDKWDPETAKEHPALKDQFEDVISEGNLLFYCEDCLASEDPAIAEAWYAYYDCENIISRRAGRQRHNPLGNLSVEQLDDVITNRNYALLSERVAKVVKLYVEAADEERDEDVVLSERFERALFEAYYADLAASKSSFLRGWGEFDRTLRNIAAAVAAREAGRSIKDVVIGGGEVVEQLSRSSAVDFGLRGELQYIDAVIAAVSDEPNIVEKERKIDAIRWSEAEDIAAYDYFNINYILSYLVKVNIVARWTLLSPEVGREMLNKLIAGLDAANLVNKQ